MDQELIHKFETKREAVLAALLDLGTSLEDKKDSFAHRTSQAKGGLQALNDVQNMLGAVKHEFDKAIESEEQEKLLLGVFNKVTKNLEIMREKCYVIMHQNAGKEEAFKEVVRQIENKYDFTKSLEANPNIGVHPKDRNTPDIKDRRVSKSKKKEKDKDKAED
jgi:hypothetical protein